MLISRKSGSYFGFMMKVCGRRDFSPNSSFLGASRRITKPGQDAYLHEKVGIHFPNPFGGTPPESQASEPQPHANCNLCKLFPFHNGLELLKRVFDGSHDCSPYHDSIHDLSKDRIRRLIFYL